MPPLNRDEPNVLRTIIDGRTYVRCLAGANDSTIDGFIISNGDAPLGGGMWNCNASPKILNCHFIDNMVDTSVSSDVAYGAAIYNSFGSSPFISNCVFENNYSDNPGQGGAIYNELSSYRIDGCFFIGNKTYSNNGGAIYNLGSNIDVFRCVFQDNFSDEEAGAIYNKSSSCKVYDSLFVDCYGGYNSGSAIYNDSSESSVTNCTFVTNRKGYGGGVSSDSGSSSFVPQSVTPFEKTMSVLFCRKW